VAPIGGHLDARLGQIRFPLVAFGREHVAAAIAKQSRRTPPWQIFNFA